MKKYLSIILIVVIALSLISCSANANQDTLDAEATETSSAISGQITPSDDSSATQTPGLESPEANAGKEGNILVAYFSWADNAILGEDVDTIASPSVVPPGNVQQLASWVRDETGGDLFPIRVTDKYPSDWDECLARANDERSSGERPQLVEDVANLEQYDAVFLGYPNWWYGVPMALLSFLERNDLSGKEVYLFCSHGTGGLANSVGQIEAAAPGALLSGDIFDCYEQDAPHSEETIREWVKGLGYSHPAQSDDETPSTQRRIRVRFGENTIVFELNDGTAADSLYAQLPLTVQVDDYSTNEKIFYPQQELDASDSPLATAGAGTLAYFAPWGNVVFFYGDYSENPGLFELGHVVSGAELIGRMSGTITIEAME